MPKLASDYNHNYGEVYDFPKLHQKENYYRYSQYAELRNANKPKVKPRKRKNMVQFLVSCIVLGVFIFGIMPYSFKNVTRAIFVPTPHKSITTDMNQLAFPLNNYLSNAWFMGNRSFRKELDRRNAQMIMQKENVNMPALKGDLLNLTEQYPAIEPAIYVWDYETGNYVDINANKVYSTASIIKIPVLIDLFKSIEAGQVSLDEKMPLTEYYRSEGSGNLQFKAANSQWTIDELARRMITDSDNSATNMIIAKIGSMTDVNQAIRDWGMKNTEVQTWLPDLTGNNRTTAREMAAMLYNIDTNDKFLTEVSRRRIIDYMSHVHNNRLIQSGLGGGAKFIHKTGDIGKMLGDAGIVTTSSGTKYIVVILANRPHNSAAGKDFIVKASNIIYNYMVK